MILCVCRQTLTLPDTARVGQWAALGISVEQRVSHKETTNTPNEQAQEHLGETDRRPGKSKHALPYAGNPYLGITARLPVIRAQSGAAIHKAGGSADGSVGAPRGAQNQQPSGKC
jgi:hypothetical protein